MATTALIIRDGDNIMFVSGVVLEKGSQYRLGKKGYYLILFDDDGTPTITCHARNKSVTYVLPLEDDGEYMLTPANGKILLTEEEERAYAIAQAAEQRTRAREQLERQEAITWGERLFSNLTGQGLVKVLAGNAPFVTDEPVSSRSRPQWVTDGTLVESGKRITVTGATYALERRTNRVVIWGEPTNDFYFVLGGGMREKSENGRDWYEAS